MGCLKDSLILQTIAVLFCLSMVALFVCFGFIMNGVCQEHVDWEKGDFKDWIIQEHEHLMAENTEINEWNKARFDYYARDLEPNNATGKNLFERRYADYPEYVAKMEEFLGCDFSDPNSWNQTAVDQRAQELEDALRYHEAEYNIKSIWNSQDVQVKSEWTYNDDWKAFNEFEDAQPKPETLPGLVPDLWASPDPEIPAHHVRAGNNLFMGTTIFAAASSGIAVMASDRHSRSNQIIAGMMLVIILVALGIGLNGMSGNFEERNLNFLQRTQYLMWISPFLMVGTYCLAKLFCDEKYASLRKQIREQKKELAVHKSNLDAAREEKWYDDDCSNESRLIKEHRQRMDGLRSKVNTCAIRFIELQAQLEQHQADKAAKNNKAAAAPQASTTVPEINRRR